MGQELYFRRKIWGLHPQDVHDHVQELIRELETANEKYTELERELASSHLRIKSAEEKERTLKDTMQMINNYSHKLDQEAQERKNQIVEAAQHEASDIMRRANEKRGILEQDLLRLQKQKQIILTDLKALCERHLALLRAESIEQDSLALLDDYEPQKELSQ